MMQHRKFENFDGYAETVGRAGNTAVRQMLSAARQFALSHFATARGSHAWDHTLRVYHLCDHIGRAEGVDMVAVRMAAYLHDIARGRQDDSNGRICHAREGARLAMCFLPQLPLKPDQINNVLHCIESHRFRSRVRPQTPEAKVLFDADKLDAIGAIGVARAFLFAGEIGARLHAPEINLDDARSYTPNDTGYREYMVKLRKIRQRILTTEGRRLAERRHRFMERFFNRFLDEYDGKR
jgi:uncharacterized protein